MWNATKINLSQPFDFVFEVNLGCIDADGADGIVFMLQPISTSLGGGGGGMGFLGVVPSIGITLDTWQNMEYNDPVYDHISIQANGVLTHGNDLAGPSPISSTSNNVEDCSWNLLRISWDPATQWLRVYFNGDLRVEAQHDLIGNIFNGDPMVYWGFSAATGGSNNLQRFCTALSPMFTTSLPFNSTCIGNPVSFTDASQSFAPIQSWLWEFGDGTTSTIQNPPPHYYINPGEYEVKLTITGLDGCVSEPLVETIVVGSKPQASFLSYDTCYRKNPRIIDQSQNAVGQIISWNWYVDDNFISSDPQPFLSGFSPGIHSLKLVLESEYGCESDTAFGEFEVFPIPTITSVVDQSGCVNEPVGFQASQTDALTSILTWNWNFGDGNGSSLSSSQHSYAAAANYNTSVWAVATNGCSSDTLFNDVYINKAEAYAGRDTFVIKDIPFQLNGSGGLQYSWSPPTGLNDPNAEDPIAVLQQDQDYVLTVTTAEGCVDSDSVSIQVFKGSAIYVPTGFTPNSDGLNDYLKPRYIGIKKLNYFRVYNRWGQLVFQTNSIDLGWDGRINGKEQPTSTFVWMISAVDFAGMNYQLRGSTSIIR